MINNMKKQRLNGNFYFVIALLIMVILFISSSQTYAQQSQIGFLSKLLSGEPFKESLSGVHFNYAGSEVSIKASGYLKFVEFFIRKGAHFATYFIMGGSLFLALYPKTKVFLLTGLVSWLAATGYAGLDEFHQMMTGGRTPLFQDVVLDSLGALTAVVIVMLVKRLRKR